MNCQIRGLASIRKGLGIENTPFLVSSNSIIASENVSGMVSGPEGSCFCQSGGVLFFANPEGSQFCESGRVLILPIRNGPVFANPEGSCFCHSGGVPNLPIRRCTIFAKKKLSGHKKANSKKY